MGRATGGDGRQRTSQRLDKVAAEQVAVPKRRPSQLVPEHEHGTPLAASGPSPQGAGVVWASDVDGIQIHAVDVLEEHDGSVAISVSPLVKSPSFFLPRWKLVVVL
jgi:hypothetical protein